MALIDPAKHFADTFNSLMRDLVELDKTFEDKALGSRLFAMLLLSSIEASSRLLIAHLNFTIETFKYRGAITEEDYIASFCEEYKIKDTGEVKRFAAFVPPKALVEFSLKYLLKFYGIPERDLFSSDGWDKMQKTIEIRHRVTHPSKAEDMQVLPEEAKICKGALVWYTHTIKGLFNEGSKAIEELRASGKIA